MRILLVSFVGDNRWSGMGKWTHSIAESARSAGHEVSMFFESDFPRLARSGRAAVLLFPLVLARVLWRRRRDFDVVVVHEPSGFWYGLLRRLVPSLPPMVAMSHGIESRRFHLLVDAAGRGYAHVPRGSRIKTPLMRLWQSDGTLRLADHVICLSSLDRDYLTSRLGRRGEDVTLMINGVEPEHFRERSNGSSARVLFVAGWLDAKGSYTLPELWRSVQARHPDASLTLVGTGAGAEQVRAAFDRADRASVRVVPRVTGRDEMVGHFAEHDVFLMPSLNEGSPLALLEAMAAGLPVVAGRAGGIPDVVTHRVDGLLFDPLDPAEGADLVNELLSDPALRDRLSAAAQARARELDWDSSARTLLRAAGAALDSARDRRALSR